MERFFKNKPLILVVDDMEENTAILETMIKSIGCRSILAGSVKEAMELMEKELPDIILSDISMPDIDGYQFCNILKKDIRTKEIPFIFISAMSSVEERIKGLRAGAVDFITKPFFLEEVRIRINTYLKIFIMQKEMEHYNLNLHTIIGEQGKKIEECQKNMLFALAAIAEGKTVREEESKLKIIAQNTHLLAQSLAFSPDFAGQISEQYVEYIEIASLLHDIGRVRMSDRFRYVGVNLTEEEKIEWMEHTELGAALLEEIGSKCENSELLRVAIDIARYHHERWDGKGYLYGKTGEEIPLAARIVKIVLSYDKLRGNNRDHVMHSKEEAIEIMRADKGVKYDPHIMNVFEKVVNQFMFVNKEY